VPFIIFPTVRLQETLREKFGGKMLWKKVSSQLEARINKDKDQLQKDIFVQKKNVQKEKEL
jgi:hypothetical protein